MLRVLVVFGLNATLICALIIIIIIIIIGISLGIICTEGKKKIIIIIITKIRKYIEE